MKIRKSLFLLFALLFAGIVVAQTKEPPQPTKGPGAPGLQLPIDDYIPAFIIVGLLIGSFILLRSIKTKSESPADV